MSSKATIVSFALILLISSLAMAADGPEGKVNINTAGSQQLELLPRVGPALAQRIIDFREANGPFAAVDELVAVKGIGETSFAKLEPYVTTEGDTTLTDKVKLPRSSAGSSKVAG